MSELVLVVLVTIGSSAVLWLMLGTSVIYQNFDGPYYGVVAKSWYVPEVIGANFSFPIPYEYYPAHLPLYPLAMLAGGLLSGNVLSGGALVTVATSALGAVAIYLIWTKNKWNNPLWVTLAWLFVWPRMLAVRSVASPETLFVLLIVFSLYAFDKKNYVIAGIAGALAALTKTPGALLFVAYGLWWAEQFWRTRKLNLQIWPICLIPLAFLGLFGFYQLQTGNFLAYFSSGDNIHLQLLPFKIFDSSQPWVGDFWLEDVLWVYLIGGIGVYLAYKKNKVWGWFGIVFLTAIAFVSHRDISRYALPIVPVVLLGISELFDKKVVRVAFLVWLIPVGLYTLNFLANNTVDIPNLAPFMTF